MLVSGRASWLNYEYVATAHVLVDLKIKLSIRETFRNGAPHVATKMARNLFRQFRIRVSRKNLNAASCAHKKVAGAGGFEPTNAGSKDRCLTTWLRPNIKPQS